MGALIRAHDWAATPLGAIETWPQSLKTAVELMLASGVPATVQFGPQAILIYNDAYIDVIGDRHPSALGRSSYESFSEIRPHLEAVFARVFAGETVILQDQHFAILQHGKPQDLWFTLSHIPVRDEAGEVIAVLVLGLDTGARILAERRRDHVEASLREGEERQRFLVELGDVLRPLADAVEIQGAAARLLGDWLGATRAYYVEYDAKERCATVARDYVAEDAPSLVGRYEYDQYRTVLERVDDGRTWIVADVAADPELAREERELLAAQGVVSWVDVPLIKQGTLVAILCVVQGEARNWTDAEVELVEQTAERTWAAVERAQAEAALRESEAEYRTLFEAIDDGLVIGEMVRDEDGRAIDFRYLEANPAMEKLVGWNPQEIAGRLVTELVSPEEAKFWVDTLKELVRTDGSKRLDHYQPSLAQWYRINATSLGANRIVSIYQNITAEKLSEAALRESEERQAFLLRLSDIFAPLTDSTDIEDVAARLLVEHLGANRAIYLEVEGSGENQVVVIRGQHARDVPRFPTRALYADYAKGFPNELLQAGRTLVVCDAVTDPRLDEDVRNVWLGSNIVAAIAASLVKDGQIVGAFGLHSAVPREWTAPEIRLVEEAAARTWTAVEASRSEVALRESEERQAFLLKLSDLLRAEADAKAIMTAAADMFAHHVGLAVAHYLSIHPDGDGYDLVGGYSDGRLAAGSEPHGRISDHGPEWGPQFRRGEAVFSDDHQMRPAADAEASRAFGVRSGSAVPLMRGGSLVAIFSTAHPEPRQWTEAEKRLQLEVADRTWAAVERARAEAALRESEERQTFLLKLSDALRPLADPVEVMAAASEALGRHLGVGRCGYGEVDETGEFFIVERDWTDGVMASFRGRHRLVSFGPEFTAAYRAGLTVLIDDALADARAAGAEAAFEAAGGVRASLGVPLIKGGRFVAGLFAQQIAPRHWSAEDEALALEVADRTWAAVERARAEGLLREREERLRHIVDSAREYAIITLDINGVITGWNSGAERLLGYAEAEAVGLSGEMFFTDEDRARDEPEKEMRNARERGRAENERWHVRKDGSRFWGSGAMLPLSNGEQSGYLKIFRDRTEERAVGEALEESEERFRAMAEAIEDVFYLTDVERNQLLYLSPAYEWIWGRPVAGLMADLPSFIETVHPDDRESFLEGKVEQDQGRPVAKEYRIVRPDGSVRWIFDRSFPTPSNDGRRSAGVASDITARKEAQEALRESEERFRQFGEASSDVLWIRDAETLQWEYLTPAFERIYGIDRASALAGDNYTNWADMILPEDRDHALKSIERVSRGDYVVFEYRVRRPSDGEIRWLRNTDFPLRDETGEIRRIGGIGQDVTELKRIEMALAGSESRLRVLTEGIPQLVWRAAGIGEWTWASPQWTAYTGQSSQASRGAGWLDMLHPDDRGGAMADWQKAEGAGAFESSYRVLHADEGRHRWFHTRATPVRDGRGRIVEWLGTSTDVDDLRQLQEEQKVLVAELQHRTRNLIAVVRSTANQTLASATSLGEFSSAFNDRLAALSRVQGFLSRPEQEPLSIGALVRLELDALGAEVGPDRITLEGPEVPLRAGSVQILALALHELATNARKYGALADGDGRIDVSWHVGKGEGEGPRLVLDWAETAKVAPGGADMRHGYGRELIERALPYTLGAATSFAVTAQGVRCRIDLPLAGRSPPAG